MATQTPTAEQTAAHEAAEAAFYARVQFDYDPTGFLYECEEHNTSFFTYCLHCAEDTGMGRESDAARIAREARLAQDLNERYGDIPF